MAISVNKSSTEKTHEDKEIVWPQILAILSACLIVFGNGLFYTWTSPAIPALLADGRITLEQSSYLTTIPSIGLIIFAPIAGKSIELIGRKKTLFLVSLPQIIAWMLIAYGASAEVFYAARALNGIADALVYSALPCYIAEVATPHVRGTWGSFLVLFSYSGNIAINVVGAYASISTTAYIFMLSPIIFVCIFVFMPESPYYLLTKNLDDDAKKALQWLRRKENVEAEFKQLKQDVNRQLSESGRIIDMFIISSNRKALLIGGIIRGAQQFSGISALFFYSQYIFQEGGSNFTASTSAILVCVALLFFNMCTSPFIERLGRRVCIITSCATCGIVLCLQSTYFYLRSETDLDLEQFKVFPIIGMLLFVIAYAIGLGVVPTMLIGELFSSSIKGKALCVMNITFGVYICISSKLFHYLMVEVGLYAPFAFFGICCFASSITSYFLISDTRGKSLEEIQQDLKSKK